MLFERKTTSSKKPYGCEDEKINFLSPINNNPGNTHILTNSSPDRILINSVHLGQQHRFHLGKPSVGWCLGSPSHTLDVCAAYNLLIPADPWLAAATRPDSEAGWSAAAQPSPGRGQLCQYDVLSSVRLQPNEHHTHSISPHGALGPAGCATPPTRVQASSTATAGIQKQEQTKSSIHTPHCAPFQKPRRRTNEETTPGAGGQSVKCLPCKH